MPRRAELLAAVIESCERDGIGNRSLREIAEAVGTSHRMLLHYFGSREELLVAVVDAVEREQMRRLAALPPGEEFVTMWAHLRAPRLRPFERLFFECYARGAQGEVPFANMHPRSVDDWCQGDAHRRLGLAVTRGLLLDLVATNDRKGVDAAAEAFAQLLRRG